MPYRPFVALHLILLMYSLGGVLGKFAASHPFLSFRFCLYYGGSIAILGVYAIVWQQIIKRLPLTAAFANKAVTVVWGIVWGALFFHEAVTAGKVTGAVLIMAGIVVYSSAEGEQRHE